MQLVSISVENYRSIAKAWKIRLGRSTTLVGPNNEGKSNLLRALVTAMTVLTQRRAAVSSSRLRRVSRKAAFEWERDFPVHLQNGSPTGESVITLEFRLEAHELVEFRERTKSGLNGTLPIRVALGPEKTRITVHKPGPGSKVLTAKSSMIADFVADRFELEYIPAVRTAESAREIVEEMVARELMTLEAEDAYRDALRRVADLQAPLLSKLSATLSETLRKFLPAIRDVRVEISEEDRYRALRRVCEITVDDGSPTLLEYKGDGVQSLAALAIMRHASDSGARGRNLVIAIEEPESHLHPRAIHEFREVLQDLAKRHQVLITTHNPLFVDRIAVRSNILVNKAKARPASSVEEVREILGVRAADNLRSADLVLVVEGEDDRKALRPLLSHLSSTLASAIRGGSVALDSLNGGANLAYKLGQLRDSLCVAHCFLDDDEAGRGAYTKAAAEGLISMASCHFTTCQGQADAECEDLFEPAIYAQIIQSQFGVSLECPAFKRAGKWSSRMREAFRSQGKTWSDALEAEVKRRVAEAVATSPEKALLLARRGPIDALVNAVTQKLAEIQSARASGRERR